MGTRAYLGLGSNLGDRLANLQRAVDLLAAQAELAVIRSSRVFETDLSFAAELDPAAFGRRPKLVRLLEDTSRIFSPLF